MALTPQGGGGTPHNPSGKLLCATWWTFGFVVMIFANIPVQYNLLSVLYSFMMIASYTTNISAFFTTHSINRNDKSLDHLILRNDIQYVLPTHSPEMYFIKRMADMENVFNNLWKEMSLNYSLTEHEAVAYEVSHYPIPTKYTKIWNSIVRNGMTRSYKDAADRVSNSNVHALIADVETINYLESRFCDFDKLQLEVIDKKSYAFGLQPGSPLKARFDSM